MKSDNRIAVDREIGRKMRERRKALGHTQEHLAAALGVGRQQIQKYETGESAMSSERLVTAADALDVSVMFLLSGINASLEREHRLLARFRAMPARLRSNFVRLLDGESA